MSTEPVKLTPRTFGERTMALPTWLPDPMTRLKTPAGIPEREMMSASAQPQPGTRSAGLNSTQLP